MASARFQNLLALTHRAADYIQIVFCAPLVRDARSLLARYTQLAARALVSAAV